MKEITMLNPKALAVAALATGAGAVIFLSSGQDLASPATPAGVGGPVPVAIPPRVSEVPSAHPVIPAAERVAPPSTAVPAPVTPPTAKRPSTATTPTRKAAPKPKRTATPRATAQQPPAYSEMDLGNGWTAYCSNGYLQPDGSCSSRPEGYHPAPTPAADPCSGTGTECLNATMPGLYNGIPGLMGGR
jgi:hypothetical protein